jgi:hypothetical protein
MPRERHVMRQLQAYLVSPLSGARRNGEGSSIGFAERVSRITLCHSLGGRWQRRWSRHIQTQRVRGAEVELWSVTPRHVVGKRSGGSTLWVLPFRTGERRQSSRRARSVRCWAWWPGFMLTGEQLTESSFVLLFRCVRKTRGLSRRFEVIKTRVECAQETLRGPQSGDRTGADCQAAEIGRLFA